MPVAGKEKFGVLCRDDMITVCHSVTYSQENHIHRRGAWWLSGRASDSGARGQGFETYLPRVVSLSKTLYSPKGLVITRKRWLRLDMTEKLLTGTVKSQHKQTNHTHRRTIFTGDESTFYNCTTEARPVTVDSELSKSISQG